MEQILLEHIPQPRRVMAPVAYAGGKGNLAGWILPFVRLAGAGKQVYCEPFAGAASILFHKEPHPNDVINDIDGDIVNLFRCLQDRATFEEFCHRVIWTPYSYAEFLRARQTLADRAAGPVDRAWAVYVYLNQAINGSKLSKSWKRTFISNRNCNDTANSWRGRMKLLQFWHDRLSRVCIECRDGLEVIRYWDSPDTVFYCDPPYIHDARKDRNIYQHEQDIGFHQRLVETLLRCRGNVVLSAYEHPLYQQLLEAGWRVVKRAVGCYLVVRSRRSVYRGAGSVVKEAPRLECLYLSPGVPAAGDVCNLEVCSGE